MGRGKKNEEGMRMEKKRKREGKRRGDEMKMKRGGEEKMRIKYDLK